MQLQQNLAANVDSPGNISFNRFRAYSGEVRQAEEPLRFVDGELIEAFLDCDPSIQAECVKGLGANVEEVKGIVEGLRRLH
jgi:DNA damage-binding protein 1